MHTSVVKQPFLSHAFNILLRSVLVQFPSHKTAVITHMDFWVKEDNVCYHIIFFCSICTGVTLLSDTIITFLKKKVLHSIFFTFNKGFLPSLLLDTKEILSDNPSLLMLLPEILIPISRFALLMIYNILHITKVIIDKLVYSFHNLEPRSCSIFHSNCGFQIVISVLQLADKVAMYPHF